MEMLEGMEGCEIEGYRKERKGEGKQTRRGGEKGKRERKTREETEEGGKVKGGRRKMLLNNKRLK